MKFVRIGNYCVNPDNIKWIKMPSKETKNLSAYGNAVQIKWCLDIQFVDSDSTSHFYVDTKEEAQGIFESITGYPSYMLSKLQDDGTQANTIEEI